MVKKLSEEKQEKIREAHEEGMTIIEASKYAGVCKNTVSNYWGEWELEPHFSWKIPEEKQEKIREAYEKGITIIEASKYAGVSHPSVLRYWRKWELEPHFPKRNVPFSYIIDGVFNTKDDPDELLGFYEIKERAEKVSGRKYSEKAVENALKIAVETAKIYDEVNIDGETKYKAAMPGIMDGLFEEYLESG